MVSLMKLGNDSLLSKKMLASVPPHRLVGDNNVANQKLVKFCWNCCSSALTGAKYWMMNCFHPNPVA
jgi:hypothetical protein